MLTNHNTELINELYGNKGYKIDVVVMKRMINLNAFNRVGEEVIDTQFMTESMSLLTGIRICSAKQGDITDNLFVKKVPLYYETDELQLIVGDSFKILTKMKPESVDMIFADHLTF